MDKFNLKNIDIKSFIDKFDKKQKITIAAIVLILILLLIVLKSCGASGNDVFNPEDKTFYVIEIESGSTALDIGNTLEENKIIESAKAFKKYSRAKGYDKDYQAGTYYLSPSLSMEEICQILVTGKIASLSFTLQEGLSIEQTAKKLADQGIGDYDKFMDIIENGDFSAYGFVNSNLGKNKLEGYLLPDTYTVPADYEEEDVIRFLLDKFDEIAYKGEYNKSSSKASLNDIIIIASIIERECKVDEERPLVASVIYNRINDGMKLQMCSTVQYILLKRTGEVKETLYDQDIQIDNPYNTYIYDGLPPGPICSPGIASIKAALNPAKTDYLFFVLSEKLDGTSNFSSDYGKFEQDKARYYEALNNQ